jgi:hypothetical protein
MEAGPEATTQLKSASNALYLTRGYLDPIIGQGGEYSAVTDGWALGITLLVALTGRSPLSIIDKCEEAFELEFADIGAEKLADGAAGWPSHVAVAIKDLVRSAGQKCLCHQSRLKRVALVDVLAILTKLTAGEREGDVDSSASSSSASAAVATPRAYEPTPLSVQVRETRKGADPQKGIKDNMLLAFNNLMPRLDAVVYVATAAAAPESFEERINFWHRECGMRADLKDTLHTLRKWANAARHHDDERWQRDGPRNEAEASKMVSAARAAIEVLER